MNMTIEYQVGAGASTLPLPAPPWACAVHPWRRLPGVRVRSNRIGPDATGTHRSDGIVCKSNEGEEGIA